MKKLILISSLISALLVSVNAAQAAHPESSIQTPERQTITLGDSIQDMVSRMKISPIKVNSYVTAPNGPKSTLAVDYTYEIENMRYVITVIDNSVSQIQSENLNK